MTNKVGTIKSVKKEESIKPKMMALPKEVQVALERVIGIMPKMVQMEVIKMASNLDLPASMMASKNGMPNFKFKFILSIKIIAFFTTIPKSAKIPINPGKLRLK